jgi:tetratricopeptide (TPR) repeat protein
MRARTTSLLLATFLGLSSNALAADTPEVERAKSAISRGDYAQAEKEVDAGKDAPSLLMKARIQLTTGRYADAIQTANRAAKLGKIPRDDAAAVKAEAWRAQGKIKEALEACKEVEGDKDARRARLIMGEMLISQGKRADARVPLRTIIDDYNNDDITATDAEGLSLVARAAHMLRSPRDANEAFNGAEKAGAKKLPETLLWRTELFLDKYDPGNAGTSARDALKLAPKSPEAHVWMARVKLENSMDFEAAESEVRQALEVNPSLASAYFVRAGLALRDLDITAADQAADAGLKVNPVDLELLSMKAAIRFLADDLPGYERVKQQVFGINAEYANFYLIVAEFAEWEHRYDDIVKMMGEAVAADRNEAKAYAQLGLNLIRTGDDKAGLDALRKAWDKDHFNIRVYNTLNLYEKDIATEYTTVDGKPFTIRYHNDEKAVLERYVPRMLNEAWTSMVQRYGFTPKIPVAIELYANPEHFSIRTSGLPNVGIQGVCFGETLAALSPAAGEFNWGNVIWHELGHVFAIQMSKNHVPRWFTEGLSEYETIVRRPEWKREEDPNLFAALKGKRIPKVEAFNRAFTHVDSVEDVTMAYYAASQIQVFLAQQFGFPKVVAMLPRWAAGERTGDVVQHTLGISADELDSRYRTWLDKGLVRYEKQFVPDLHVPPLDDARKAAKAAPTDAKRLVELAMALLADGQGPEGEATLDEAARVAPKDGNVTYVRLRMAMKKKDLDGAAKLVAKLIADGNDGYASRMKAADIAEAKKDTAGERQNLELAAKFDPTQEEPLQGLYDLAHKAKDEDGELAALRRLSLLDQHSRVVWKRLLELLVGRGLWDEGAAVGESALFVDVMNPKVHRLYARALARTGKFVSAIYELNSAIACKPKPDEMGEIYGELAKGYDALGKADLAKQARDFQKQMGTPKP